MLYALPSLKDFTYWLSWVSVDKLFSNSPESAATLRDIVPLSVQGINRKRQCYSPSITPLNIHIGKYQSMLVRQVFEVMFQEL